MPSLPTTSQLQLFKDGILVSQDIGKLFVPATHCSNLLFYGLDLYSRCNYHLLLSFLEITNGVTDEDQAQDLLHKPAVKETLQKLTACTYLGVCPGESDAAVLAFDKSLFVPPADVLVEDSDFVPGMKFYQTARYGVQQPLPQQPPAKMTTIRPQED